MYIIINLDKSRALKQRKVTSSWKLIFINPLLAFSFFLPSIPHSISCSPALFLFHFRCVIFPSLSLYHSAVLFSLFSCSFFSFSYKKIRRNFQSWKLKLPSRQERERECGGWGEEWEWEWVEWVWNDATTEVE